MYYSSKNIDFLYVWELIGDIRVAVSISDICLCSSELVYEVVELIDSNVGRSKPVVPVEIEGIKKVDPINIVADSKAIKRGEEVLLGGKHSVCCAATTIWRLGEKVIPMPEWII